MLRPAPAAIVGAIVLAAIVFVAYSLRRPQPDAYPPTPAGMHAARDSSSGVFTYTIDASAVAEWRYFAVTRGSVVARADAVQWDVAFRRYHIIINGGAGFAGRGGALNLGAVPFDSVLAAPAGGYVTSVAGRDSSNAAFDRWYQYSWTSHVLKPKPHVWVVRTADGRYVKLRIISYYCPGARPGCVTFRYAFLR
ncbi:MAG: HmuY family protein [Gemmatimonadota bacterium]